MVLLQVAAGGAAGAVLRYLVVQASGRWLGAGFPYGTVLVNIGGSFVMGLVAVALLGRSGMTPLVMAGFLGGFTTFSAFSLDAVSLFERGETWAAAVYVALSVAGSILALMAGLLIARGLTA